MSSLLRLSAAVFVGSGITAGTTYALVRHVQHLIATATVSSDPTVWMDQARTHGYEACYFGCNDCDDPSFAAKACARTAQAVNVTGVFTCDGSRMWNWKDRYPRPCLQAVGEFYKADALAALKQSYRNQLALIILTVVAGVLGAVVTFIVWGIVARKRERKKANRFTPRYDYESYPKGSKAKRRNPLLLLASFLLTPFCRSSAFPCTGYGDSVTKYFANANHTIIGVVHGWFSNCYTYTICTPSCSTSCSSGSCGGGGPFGTGGSCTTSCTTSCTQSCTTYTWYDTAPAEYVARILPNITACGFALVDAVEGDVNMRVANPGIEKNWWAKISVNGYNITETTVTDRQIWCLHDLGNK